MIPNDQITLQINLSPGDANYAASTVPRLIAQHPDITNRLLVVDCCRPQKTRLVDPDTRYPLSSFNLNKERIVSLSNGFLKDGLVSAVYFLNPSDELIPLLAKKYLRNLYRCTHAAGGTANMSYWAAIELPKTRYVLHYDGDIIIYQKPGYHWVDDALNHLIELEDCVMAVPRLCPPPGGDTNLPSLREGRPISSFNSYWLNDWFSTRHFLLDKERLEKYLPLIYGLTYMEILARKYGRRAFPPDPEIILFKGIKNKGGRRLILKNENAWLLHPANKSKRFLDLLPGILGAVENGKFPEGQRGIENIQLDSWETYFT